MPELSALIDANLPVLLAVLAVLTLLALVAALLLARSVRRLRKRLDGLTRGGDGTSLEGALESNLWRVERLGGELSSVTERTATLERLRPLAVQKIGLVRFNPFEDTGSNQSFALALLDDHDDGVIVSSLHSRQQTRLYAKPITGGRSDTALSTEETEAVRLARDGRRETTKKA